MPAPWSDDRPSLKLTGADHAPELDERHYAMLEQTVRLSRPIRKAAGYAAFSGWATLLAGACSLPFTIGNVAMMIFCVVLAGIGTRELSLRRRLLRLETSVLRKLAINQLMLGAVLCSYAIFQLLQPSGESMLVSAMNSDPSIQSVPGIADQLNDLAQLERVIMAGIYALMILVALFVQGGSAIYYSLKIRAMRRLHQRTPGWCVRVYSTIHG